LFLWLNRFAGEPKLSGSPQPHYDRSSRSPGPDSHSPSGFSRKDPRIRSTKEDLEVRPLRTRRILSRTTSARMKRVETDRTRMDDWLHARRQSFPICARTSSQILRIRGRCRFGGVGRANSGIHLQRGTRIRWSVACRMGQVKRRRRRGAKFASVRPSVRKSRVWGRICTRCHTPKSGLAVGDPVGPRARRRLVRGHPLAPCSPLPGSYRPGARHSTRGASRERGGGTTHPMPQSLARLYIALIVSTDGNPDWPQLGPNEGAVAPPGNRSGSGPAGGGGPRADRP
jgi:hypothetical protein